MKIATRLLAAACPAVYITLAATPSRVGVAVSVGVAYTVLGAALFSTGLPWT